MEVNHLCKLAIEVFKTIKSSNPDFMYAYFKKDLHSAGEKITYSLIGQKLLHSVKRA